MDNLIESLTTCFGATKIAKKNRSKSHRTRGQAITADADADEIDRAKAELYKKDEEIPDEDVIGYFAEVDEYPEEWGEDENNGVYRQQKTGRTSTPK